MPNPVVTDYHAQVRDAVRDVLAALPLSVPVVALDDPEADMAAGVDMPCVVVACVGPEQERSELSTNASDGIQYSCVVMLAAGGVTSGAKSPNVPEITEFRRLVRTTFNNKRLSGVAQVGWCEVSDSGELFSKDSPAFQKITTALVVSAIGRFPRTDS